MAACLLRWRDAHAQCSSEEARDAVVAAAQPLNRWAKAARKVLLAARSRIGLRRRNGETSPRRQHALAELRRRGRGVSDERTTVLCTRVRGSRQQSWPHCLGGSWELTRGCGCRKLGHAWDQVVRGLARPPGVRGIGPTWGSRRPRNEFLHVHARHPLANGRDGSARHNSFSQTASRA
jgi:hypothetical protein